MKEGKILVEGEEAYILATMLIYRRLAAVKMTGNDETKLQMKIVEKNELCLIIFVDSS